MVEQSVYEPFEPFKSGENIPVEIGGVAHFVESAGTQYKISRNSNDSDWDSFFIRKDSPTLKRSEADFAETFLRVFFEARPPNPTQSINAMTSIEGFLERPVSKVLFKTLFVELSRNNPANDRLRLIIGLSKDSQKILVSNRGNKPFLSVAKNETDQEILGRLLCGVLLYQGKSKEEILERT